MQLSTWERCQVLGARELSIYPRDKIRFTARIFNAIFMGLMLGAIYADIEAENLSAFAMVGIEMPVIQSIASLPCLFRDRQFFHLESEQGLYTTTPFYMTTYFLGMIFSCLTVFLQIFVTYTFTMLPWWPFFPLTYLACLTGFFMMDAVLFVLCYYSKDLDTAFLYFNFTLGIFMFANGFTMNKVTSGDYINWLLYTSPIFYAMSAVLNAFIHFGDYSDADVVERTYTCTGRWGRMFRPIEQQHLFPQHCNHAHSGGSYPLFRFLLLSNYEPTSTLVNFQQDTCFQQLCKKMGNIGIDFFIPTCFSFVHLFP